MQTIAVFCKKGFLYYRLKGAFIKTMGIHASIVDNAKKSG
jgi:hypothetical protein